MRRFASFLLVALCGCTPLVRYTNSLVGANGGRTWFTRLPAAIGATAGFVIGVPVDLVALPATWIYYRSQAKETRDLISVVLFPSFVLWKAGALIGTPFDVIEWSTIRWWQGSPPLTEQERDAIERAWDQKEFSEYPVTPIYPLPPGQSPPDGTH